MCRTVDGCEIQKSHHFEAVVEIGVCGIYVGESNQKPGLLRRCETDFVHPA